MEYFRNKRTGLLKTIKCDCCGNKFIAGSSNGLPNGVGFETDDGKLVNICKLCLMNKSKLNKFLEERGIDIESNNNKSNK